MRALSFFLVFLLLATMANAQIVDRTKERAKDKTNNRIENRIDRGIDKGLDGVEGLFKKKNKEDKELEEESTTGSEKDMNQAGQGGLNLGGKFAGKDEVKASYDFEHEVDYHMTNTKKNGKVDDEMDMTMLITESADMFGMKVLTDNASSTVVYDMEKSLMLTLTDSEGNKTGMAIRLDEAQINEAVEEEIEDSTGKFAKTGRTKTILGYTCEEWAGEEDGSRTEAWMSSEVGFNLMRAMKFMENEKKSKGSQFGSADIPGGLLMESTTTDLKSGEVNHMVATRVAKNSNTSVKTGGYSFFSFGQ